MKLKTRLKVILLIVLIGAGGIVLFFFIFKDKKGNLNSPPSSNFQDRKVEISKDSDLEKLTKIPIETKPISIITVGDLMLSRNVGNAMNERNDYHFPIKNTRDFLRSADLTFGNLECPICEGRKIGIHEMSFRADPETLETLTYGGFDVMSLANNHTMNFGSQCLEDTFKYLNKADIDYVGAGEDFQNSHKALTKNINGHKIAFLAYNDSDVVPSSYFATSSTAGTNEMDIQQLKKDINKLKAYSLEPTAIIVSMHSGTEYTSVPNSRQKKFAHAAIDYGADIVIGHHPHVVQHIEKYKGKFIIYSLGNFIFDQMIFENCTKELAAKLTVEDDGIKEVEVVPVRMKKFVETNIAKGQEKEEILNIINYKTEQQPKILFENEKYKTECRDVLKDTVLKSKVITIETLKNKKQHKLWNAENEELSVVQSNGQLYVLPYVQSNSQSYEPLFSTDPDWTISDFEIANVDNDPQQELLVAFWRVGDYGKKLEGMRDKRGDNLSSHLFVYKFEDNETKLKWGGSTVDYPIIDFEIADVDNDKENELVVLEGRYNDFDKNEMNGKSIALWGWNGWGFTKEYRMRNMTISDFWVSGDEVYISGNMK